MSEATSTTGERAATKPDGGPSDEVAPPAGESGAVVERASIKRNVAQMTASQITTWIFATVASIIIPRYLGPTIHGRMQVAASLWIIADVFMALGTSKYLQLQISRNEREGLRLVAPIMFLRTIAFFVAAGAIGVYVAATDNGPGFGDFVILYGVAALFALWSDVFTSGFMGLEVMSSVAKINAGMRFVGVATSIIVLVLGGGVYELLWAYVCVALVTLLLLGARFRRLVRIPIAGWGAHAKPALLGSVSFMAVGLVLVFYRQIDVIVISQVAGERDVGWYTTADVLAGSIFFPTTVIMASVFPTLGRLHAENPDALRHLVRRMFSLLILVAVPIGLGAAVIGPTFAPLLLGDRFDGAGEALAVLAPVAILTFATTMIANVALATGRNRFLVLVLAASAVATIPLDLMLVPWAADRFDNGAIGGALAYVITETGQFMAGMIVITPYLLTRSIVWRSVRVLASGLLMFAATWPFREQFFLIPVAIGVVVYPTAVLLVRALDADQRDLIGEVLARVGLRTRWAPVPSHDDAGDASAPDDRSVDVDRSTSFAPPTGHPLAPPDGRVLPPPTHGETDRA